jgi:hypothetical protein
MMGAAMNVRNWLSKPKFYFLAIAPLLLATALVKTVCPVCDGRGTFAESVNMSNVRIISVDSRILSIQMDACSLYVVVNSSPILSVSNLDDEPAKGWLKLDLVEGEKVLATQYLLVDLGPTTFANVEYPVVFGFPAINAEPSEVEIRAEVADDDAPCVACNGGGHIALNTYLMAKVSRDRLVQVIKEMQEFEPPLAPGELEPWAAD